MESTSYNISVKTEILSVNKTVVAGKVTEKVTEVKAESKVKMTQDGTSHYGTLQMGSEVKGSKLKRSEIKENELKSEIKENELKDDSRRTSMAISKVKEHKVKEHKMTEQVTVKITESNTTTTLTKGQKYMTTIILFYVMFAYGMICSVLGPSLVDLGYILSTTFSQVSLITTVTSLGYCIGALVGGFAFQYLNRQLFVIIFMSITSLVCAFFPFSPSLIIFLTLGVVFSFGNGTLDVAQNTWYIEMWPEHSNSVLQLAQFMYGLGMIVAPIIEEPYLTGDPTENNATDHDTFIDFNSITGYDILTLFHHHKRNVSGHHKHNISDHETHTITRHGRRMLLAKPFAVIGIVQLSAIILLMLMYCYKKYEPPTQVENNNSETKLFESAPKLLNILMITLISMFLGFYISVEYCHFSYLVSYAQYKMKMTASDGALLQSVQSASYTAMRAVGALIALKLSPEKMIIIHLAVVIGSNVGLLFCSHSRTLFWVFNIVLGAGFSTMWGSIFSFAEQYLVFGNFAGTMLITMSGGLSMISLYFVGNLIESHPEILIYFNLINGLLSVILFLFVKIIIVTWSRRTWNIQKVKVSKKRLSITSIGATVSYLSRNSN